MSLCRINTAARGLLLHDSTQTALPELHKAARSGVRRAVIMVHGYKYSPFVPAHCPHAKLFAEHRWPADLGAAERDTLVVAFGWHARGALHRVHDSALTQARALATGVATLARAGLQVDLVAHSLGATVALAALPYLNHGDVGRIVLLNGAAQRCVARHAMATPAGTGAHAVHVTSRENAIFDLMFELLVPGAGGLCRLRELPTLWIDSDRTRARLHSLGYPVAPPDRAVSHWSSYTRAGVMALNAALLEGRLPVSALPGPPPPGRAWRRTALALARQSGIMRGDPQPKAPANEPAY